MTDSFLGCRRRTRSASGAAAGNRVLPAADFCAKWQAEKNLPSPKKLFGSRRCSEIYEVLNYVSTSLQMKGHVNDYNLAFYSLYLFNITYNTQILPHTI